MKIQNTKTVPFKFLTRSVFYQQWKQRPRVDNSYRQVVDKMGEYNQILRFPLLSISFLLVKLPPRNLGSVHSFIFQKSSQKAYTVISRYLKPDILGKKLFTLIFWGYSFAFSKDFRFYYLIKDQHFLWETDCKYFRLRSHPVSVTTT